MTASTFDTLAAADRFRDAGFDDAQSRAIVDVHRDAGEGLTTVGRPSPIHHARRESCDI